MMKSTISCIYIHNFFRHRILVINLKSWRWAETGGCRTWSGMSTASLHTGHIHRGDPGHPQLSVDRSSGLTGYPTFIRINEWFVESIDRWLKNSWLHYHDDNNNPNISLDDISFQFHVDCEVNLSVGPTRPRRRCSAPSRAETRWWPWPRTRCLTYWCSCLPTSTRRRSRKLRAGGPGLRSVTSSSSSVAVVWLLAMCSRWNCIECVETES